MGPSAGPHIRARRAVKRCATNRAKQKTHVPILCRARYFWEGATETQQANYCLWPYFGWEMLLKAHFWGRNGVVWGFGLFALLPRACVRAFGRGKYAFFCCARACVRWRGGEMSLWQGQLFGDFEKIPEQLFPAARVRAYEGGREEERITP